MEKNEVRSMKQVQEEHLCRDIRRIAQGIERIAGALEKLAAKNGSIEELKERAERHEDDLK